MNPMIRFFLPVLFFSFCSSAQNSWTLQQCIDTAIARNIPVKQAELNVESAQVNLNQARMNILPDLNADINHNLNSGRSIDPFTNTYVTQNVNAANYTIGSGITIFKGFALQNNIRSNSFAYDATRMEWQQAKDNLVL
ncbi:MAG: TolC family protein, partial [Flavisolibacter sp.]